MCDVYLFICLLSEYYTLCCQRYIYCSVQQFVFCFFLQKYPDYCCPLSLPTFPCWTSDFFLNIAMAVRYKRRMPLLQKRVFRKAAAVDIVPSYNLNQHLTDLAVFFFFFPLSRALWVTSGKMLTLFCSYHFLKMFDVI